MHPKLPCTQYRQRNTDVPLTILVHNSRKAPWAHTRQRSPPRRSARRCRCHTRPPATRAQRAANAAFPQPGGPRKMAVLLRQKSDSERDAALRKGPTARFPFLSPFNKPTRYRTPVPASQRPRNTSAGGPRQRGRSGRHRRRLPRAGPGSAAPHLSRRPGPAPPHPATDRRLSERTARAWEPRLGGGKDSVNHRNARSHPKATTAPAPLTEPRRALRGRGRAPFPRRTAAPRAFYKAQRHARCLSKHEKNRNGTVRNRNGNASGNAFRTTAAAPAPRSPSPHSSAAVPSAPARHCRARCAPRKRHPAVPARGPHSPCAPRAAGAALCTQHSGAAAAGR